MPQPAKITESNTAIVKNSRRPVGLLPSNITSKNSGGDFERESRSGAGSLSRHGPLRRSQTQIEQEYIDQKVEKNSTVNKRNKTSKKRYGGGGGAPAIVESQDLLRTVEEMN